MAVLIAMVLMQAIVCESVAIVSQGKSVQAKLPTMDIDSAVEKFVYSIRNEMPAPWKPVSDSGATSTPSTDHRALFGTQANKNSKMHCTYGTNGK